jgi:hypothetical protein
MPAEEMVGTDVVSLLKSIKWSCERALGDFAKERAKHDPANFADAAECFSEIEELIGGNKLPLYIEILKGAARREIHER